MNSVNSKFYQLSCLQKLKKREMFLMQRDVNFFRLYKKRNNLFQSSSMKQCLLPKIMFRKTKRIEYDISKNNSLLLQQRPVLNFYTPMNISNLNIKKLEENIVVNNMKIGLKKNQYKSCDDLLSPLIIWGNKKRIPRMKIKKENDVRKMDIKSLEESSQTDIKVC